MFGNNTGGGMGMLLKSMGFDPEEIKSQFSAFQTTMGNTLQHFDAQQTLIISNQQIILSKLEGLTCANQTQPPPLMT